ncbi:MAG TPA: response regulator [Acidobacteriaceae bacterium]|nr:response regulator [Acidobacteriaceae bacterium]
MTKPQTILHVCNREMLRPLRDEVLRVNGYQVESTTEAEAARKRLAQKDFDLIMIDLESEQRIPEAEALCADVKTANPKQLVAFVCNYRVALQTDCPDDIIRSEFNPQAFVNGVRLLLDGTSA